MNRMYYTKINFLTQRTVFKVLFIYIYFFVRVRTHASLKIYRFKKMATLIKKYT